MVNSKFLRSVCILFCKTAHILFAIFQFVTNIMSNYDWFRIALSIDELDFGNSNIALTEVNGKKICIGRYAGKLLRLLISARMPEAFLPMDILMRLATWCVLCTAINSAWPMAATRVVKGTT